MSDEFPNYDAPVITVKYNETSHTLTLRRDGYQTYYAKQVDKNLCTSRSNRIAEIIWIKMAWLIGNLSTMITAAFNEQTIREQTVTAI